MNSNRGSLSGQALFAANDSSLSWSILLGAAALAFCLAVLPAQAATTVVAWGDNDSSQCTIPNHPGPRIVTAVAAGVNHSLALENIGAIVGWGDNAYGEASAPAKASNVVAIAAGNGFSLALQSNGVVVAWGSQNTTPAGLTNAVVIGACSNNLMALTADGNVFSWGVVGAPPDSVTNVVAIAAGNLFSLALRGDGTVIGWGDNSAGQTTIPTGLTNVVQLAAGASNSLALQADGTVIAWGDNTWGQSTVPAGLANVVAIAAGARHAVALEQNGTMVAWGDDSFNQLGVPYGLTNVFGIAAGSFHTLAVVGGGLPVITVGPISQYNPDTGMASFCALAAGAGPLSYQWLENGTNLLGATNSLLMFTNFASTTAALFAVTITNSLGKVTSVSVTLPPALQPPFVSLQPNSMTVNCGGPALFQTAATGTAPLQYQWQFNGANLPGATNLTLSLAAVTENNAGNYTLVVTNSIGVATSQVAVLTVNGQPPLITSPVTASGKQGMAFSYTIAGLNYPSAFTASGLPNGLSVNPANGQISGAPYESGTFVVLLGTANLCASAATNLTLTIASSVPVITSALTATGEEQTAFTNTILASNSPLSFGANNLPQGLVVDPVSGLISGAPVFAGNYTVTLLASNTWGIGSANLQLTVTNEVVTNGIWIANFTTNYSSPYLLDFSFTIRGDTNSAVGTAIVADPSLFTVTAIETFGDYGITNTVDTNLTSVLLQGGNQSVSAKVLKAYLVLDFSEAVADAVGGALDSNGVPVAVDTEVSAAEAFVNEQSVSAQIGVYEFHREDVAPKQVISLTTDKTLLDNDIAGIWTNDVMNFPAGSRCWDALDAAILALGTNNIEEQHIVVLCSDGIDTSSTKKVTDVINDASNASVVVYCVGFGNAIDVQDLTNITTQTQGSYYQATDLPTLAADFGLISKDISGSYYLRWATLNRAPIAFMPSFQVTYQNQTAYSPTNPPPFISGTNYVVNTNSTPNVTNANPIWTTNYIISPYLPTTFAGNVAVGSLQLEADAQVLPSAITLLANYVPRYIRQIHLHYQANWPCTLSLQATNAGEQLYGWSLTQTNDGAGGEWAWLTSPDPQLLSSSIPFASFGPLLNFSFHDVLNASNAFSLFAIDNTIYTNVGGQSFVVNNTNAFITKYPALPHGTPVPWLIQYGFTNPSAWASDETNDLNGNGLMIWQDYLAGLNPTNRSSVFAVQSLSASGLPVVYQITFLTALGRTYRVDTSTDLITWLPLQDGIAGTGGEVTVTDSRYLGAPSAYYRVTVY
jgi:hypothetical protein